VAPNRTLTARLAVLAAVTALTGGVLLGTGSAAADADLHRPQTNGPCAYTSTPERPAARPVPLPPDPRYTPDSGWVRVELRTNHGYLTLMLDRAKAPCTVQSFVHLTTHRFYDETFCHRLTAYPTLKVLQCGDPSGTGSGSPGYRYGDELPTDLLPAPTDPTGQRRIYPRATLAMANAGPDTNGSQFFVVYGDSALRPNYSIFGTVTPEGMATLDRIAAGGVQPRPGGPTPPVDGPPVLHTDIHDAQITARSVW
jgi:peptidyl-prolyl cis-trans isomerase B (cyclophilin B)